MRSAIWHISGILLTAVFVASRTPAVASVKPMGSPNGTGAF